MLKIKNLLTGETLEITISEWIELKKEVVTASEAAAANTTIKAGSPKYQNLSAAQPQQKSIEKARVTITQTTAQPLGQTKKQKKCNC